MLDFTNSTEEFNSYKGSEKKKTLIKNNKRYLVKFPDPIREKNKKISYINNAYSEYVGSNIFRICGFDVQNTILGIYKYNGKEKIVCACEDFTDDKHILYEFESLTLSSNPDKKIETEISDIMDVIEENNKLINIEDTKNKFWDMFIIDSLIGNTDRHNGNWGFILDKENNNISFSPIYDCGSCLNPILEDDELKELSINEVKNLAINCHSCLKVDNKRINYINYLKDMNNKACNEAILRCFDNIKIDEINNFIDGIEVISDVRRDFYKDIINIRYNVLKEIYNILTNDWQTHKNILQWYRHLQSIF